jgi:hypothetical protein
MMFDAFGWLVANWGTPKKAEEVESPADTRLREIADIMFPPLEKRSYVDDDGRERTYYVDSSLDLCLDGVIADIEAGYCDDTALESLKSTAYKIYEVRKLLDANSTIPSDADAVVVNNRNDDAVDDIVAMDENKY